MEAGALAQLFAILMGRSKIKNSKGEAGDRDVIREVEERCVSIISNLFQVGGWCGVGVGVGVGVGGVGGGGVGGVWVVCQGGGRVVCGWVCGVRSAWVVWVREEASVV